MINDMYLFATEKQCDSCGDAPSVYCEQCEEEYCTQCSILRHKHPTRQGHKIIVLAPQHPDGNSIIVVHVCAVHKGISFRYC
jgi:hypothetical protein